MNRQINAGSLSHRRIAGSQAAVGLSLFHLRYLLRAGVGLDEALGEIHTLESRNGMRRVWSDLANRVQSGEKLSESMCAWPGVFNGVLVALIRSGEASGDMPTACDSCHDLLEWQVATQARLLTVLVYPLFALLVLAAVLIFLFTSVVPSMKGFLAASESGTAWHTNVLLAISDWMAVAALPLIACLMVLALALLALYRQGGLFRQLADRYLLSVPLFGSLLVELALSRYASTCSRLYGSGIELDQAMTHSEQLVGNRALRQQLVAIRQRVLAGSSLGAALACAKGMPGSFSRLLAAGESTGALGQALRQAGEQHHRHAQYQLDRVERLTGPVVLLLVGAILMWIVVSVFGPVYESAIDAVLQS